MYCFKSDGDKPVRFQMRTYYDDAVGWSGGMVRYAKAKTALPLVVEHVDEEVLAEGARTSSRRPGSRWSTAGSTDGTR